MAVSVGQRPCCGRADRVVANRKRGRRELTRVSEWPPDALASHRVRRLSLRQRRDALHCAAMRSAAFPVCLCSAGHPSDPIPPPADHCSQTTGSGADWTCAAHATPRHAHAHASGDEPADSQPGEHANASVEPSSGARLTTAPFSLFAADTRAASPRVALHWSSLFCRRLVEYSSWRIASPPADGLGHGHSDAAAVRPSGRVGGRVSLWRGVLSHGTRLTAPPGPGAINSFPTLHAPARFAAERAVHKRNGARAIPPACARRDAFS